MTAEPTIVDRFVAQFDARKASLPGAGLGWLTRAREDALGRFAAVGLPSTKVEAWKYTNLGALAKLDFAPAAPAKNGIAAASLPWLLPEEAKAHRLVFVNGYLRADLSKIGVLPQGVVLSGLAAALEREPAKLEGAWGATSAEGQPMAALNGAFAADGFVLRLAENVALEAPIEIIHMGVPSDRPTAYHPRVLIVAAAGSSATILEQHVGEGAYFTNGVTDISLSAGAVLAHYKLQAESPDAFHIATHRITVGENARYDSFVLAAGGRLARTEIAVALAGRGAACRLDGAYMGRRRQLIDNTTTIDHLKPDTVSREIYKGVLDDQARGVFQGRIHVHPGADKTDGQQTCRTLLLSDGAEIDAKPELEIYADDVKCSHGAAAGELDDEALFYLRSRGIPEMQARHMLVEAFLADAVDGIGDARVREGFRRVIAGWLAPVSDVQAAE